MFANVLKAMLVLSVVGMAWATPACGNGATVCPALELNIKEPGDLPSEPAGPGETKFTPSTPTLLQAGGVVWVRLESIAQGRVLLVGEGMRLEAGQTYMLGGSNYTLTPDATALDLSTSQVMP